MIKVGKTTRTDLTAKDLCVYGNKILDEGEIINLVEIIKSAVGENELFDLKVTKSKKEDVDIEDPLDVEADELEEIED